MVRVRRRLANGSVAIALGMLTVPTWTLAGGYPSLPGEPAASGFTAPSDSSDVARTAPQAAAVAFQTLTGDGAVTTTTNGGTGPCSNATCNSSNGDCECDTYTGTFTVSPIGKAVFSFNNTVNLDDSVNSGGGEGLCFPFSGTGTITTIKNAVSFAATGTACNEFDFSSTTALLINQAAYYITPSQGTGKYIAAQGSGNLVLTLNFSNNTGTVHIQGNIQP